jgi:uncharacterized membrane protein
MSLKVLLAGESWTSLGLHLKGFSIYTTGGYEEGGKVLIDALQSQKIEVTYIPNHLVPRDFPNTLEGLQDYDAIILSDIGADTFLLHPDTLTKSLRRPNTLKVMAEYISQGGGLLMVGGFMSFSGFGGNACYHNTIFADVLPVKMLGYDDRVECPEGVNPQVVGDHKVLSGIPREWPHFLGYQRFTAKPEAVTVLKEGNDPFLVLGQYGEGRVAAFASDCSPHWGSPEFVAWQFYSRFWSQLVDWIARK